MMRFEGNSAIKPDASGDYVRFTDVHELCTSTVGFVENLLNLLEEGELTKSDAVSALKAMFRLSLSD